MGVTVTPDSTVDLNLLIKYCYVNSIHARALALVTDPVTELAPPLRYLTAEAAVWPLTLPLMPHNIASIRVATVHDMHVQVTLDKHGSIYNYSCAVSCILPSRSPIPGPMPSWCHRASFYNHYSTSAVVYYYYNASLLLYSTSLTCDHHHGAVALPHSQITTHWVPSDLTSLSSLRVPLRPYHTTTAHPCCCVASYLFTLHVT